MYIDFLRAAADAKTLYTKFARRWDRIEDVDLVFRGSFESNPTTDNTQ